MRCSLLIPLSLHRHPVGSAKVRGVQLALLIPAKLVFRCFLVDYVNQDPSVRL